jgi:hypothetical protein
MSANDEESLRLTLHVLNSGGGGEWMLDKRKSPVGADEGVAQRPCEREQVTKKRENAPQ